jgi:lipoyl(octanoyl) transferase
LRKLNIRWLGNLPYSEALILQKGLKESVSKEYNPYDYLLLLEHNNVITIGRTGDPKNILLDSDQLEKKGIEFFETDRGGDVTFHGKGQLIGYPIIRLEDPKKVIPFVRSLETTIIETLKSFNIDSFSKEDDTGVWTSEGKIASIGIKVSKWTTYHGFSLNIFDNLDGFNLINPCGNEDEKIAAVQTFNKEVSFDDVVKKVNEIFPVVYGYQDTDVKMSQFTPTQLKKQKKHEIDEMVDRGVFQKNKNIIPITIKGLLPDEPQRPEWMKVKANLGKDYRDLKNLISEKN